MASEAVYHHLIPQTYMKPWCFSGKTIRTYDKTTGEWDDRNIENICGINYFHSIMAGNLYHTTDALEKIWGFLDLYHISYNGTQLDTKEKLNANYWAFDNWEIRYPKGAIVNKAHRNEIKAKVQQTKVNDIEEQWSVLFENGWNNVRDTINQALIDIHNKKPIALTTYASSELMKYFVMFDWRRIAGNDLFNDAFERLDNILALSSIEIPEEERIHSTHTTAKDEFKHEILKSTFEKFQNNCGVMYTQWEEYKKRFTFLFWLAPQNQNFITSDNPCFYFKNKDGEVEPFFVIHPNLAMSLAKKDENACNSYKIKELSETELQEYNSVIFEYADNLVLNNVSFDVKQFEKL